MNERFHKLAWAAAVTGSAVWMPVLSNAANSKMSDGIRQGEATQSQIKTQVQRTTEDLTSIISELNRNGIGGEDVKVLGKIRDVLGDLTVKDMAVVIALLQEARTSLDPSKFRGDATQAVVNQKSIIVKMRQLLLEYKRQQELYELSLRFTQMADEQHANLRDAKFLVKSTGGKQSTEYNEIQRSAIHVQTSNEEALRDETRSLLAKLVSLAAESDAETADRLKKSIEHAKKGLLEESLNAAVSSLKDAHPHSAASSERNARDRLYELASLIAPIEDTATKLRKAAEKLDRAIAEEKLVIGLTGNLPPAAPTMDEDYDKVEDKQGDNVDLTDRLRKEIDILAPTVVDVLKLAQDKMQETRTALNARHRDTAGATENLSLIKLQEARVMLDVQIARADADKPTGDNLEQTRALREKVAQLRMDQEKLNELAKPATPRTAPELARTELKLEQTAKDLQIETAPESLPASQEISSAVKEMEKAQETLDKGAAAAAQMPGKSAVDHLVSAEKLLDQQIAKLEHDKEQLAKLEESRDKVAKLIQDEQRIALDTAQEVGKEEAQKQAEPTKPDPTKEKQTADANKETARKQAEVATKTEEAKQTLPEEGREAAQPLDQARQDMNKAKDSLDQNEAKPAQPNEQQALNDLNKAKDALDQKIGELQKELGQPQDNSQKLDQLAKALDQAQQDLNKAQQQMQEDPAQLLAKEQQKIADQLQKKQDKNPKNEPLQKAQKSAQKAAKQLAQNDLPGAIQEMQKTQESIKEADRGDKPDEKGEPAPDAKGEGKEESMKEVGQDQAAVQKAAEQLASAPKPQPMQQTAQKLGQVANDVTDAAATDKGALPKSAEQALQQAESALNEAATKAQSGDQPNASSKTAAAQSAISQAQAAVALAQQGMQPGQMADAKGPPGEPAGPPGEPGKDPSPGKPAPGQPAPTPGQADENTPSQQAVGDRKDTTAKAAGSGPRGNVTGAGTFMSLPARDRAALKQTQKDKYPEEYGPAIEQYLKNLSDQENR